MMFLVYDKWACKGNFNKCSLRSEIMHKKREMFLFGILSGHVGLSNVRLVYMDCCHHACTVSVLTKRYESSSVRVGGIRCNSTRVLISLNHDVSFHTPLRT